VYLLQGMDAGERPGISPKEVQLQNERGYHNIIIRNSSDCRFYHHNFIDEL
jgi:hypothetical protein